MLSIIGGGKMGAALLSAFVEGGRATDFAVVEREPATVDALRGAHPDVHVSTEPVPCDAALIAVKPKDVELAVSDAVNAGAQRILSVAAGVTLARLHEWAGGHIPVVRAMPNIGAMVHESATAICGGVTAHEDDMVWAEQLLGAAGSVVRVAEEQMDAVTGLSGSGPAYVFLIAEALIDAGVHAGLPVDVAKELTLATLSGATALLVEGEDPSRLRAMVTTPAGTTAAGLRVLEERAVRAACIDAVAAAAERSRELGRR